MTTARAKTLGIAKTAAVNRRVGRVVRVLHLWHLTSLDAPTVAVVWGGAFAWAEHVRLTAWPLVLLGLVVWAVYVGDRLLDARAGRELRERHYFHWRHRRVLAPLAVAASMVAAAIVGRRVPAMALPQDSAVALATLAYFSEVHGRLKLPEAARRVAAFLGWREWLVGALFAAGCVLPAWSADPVAAGLRVLILPVAFFSALAWLNVRAISRWESGSRLGRSVWALAAIGVVLAAGLAMVEPRSAALVAAGAVSAGLMGWLDVCSEPAGQRVCKSAGQRVGESAWLEPVTLRAAVDLVLLTPLLVVMWR